MKTIFHPANERGHADHGWLNAYHSFSFASWYDPSKVHFGMLRVLNDDTVAPGMGFGMHPHDNMEIVTIPIDGVLEHKDSTGGNGTISVGEVQIMSAGTGVYHSEFNGSKSQPVKLFQTWVFPKEKDITPRYDQKVFAKENRMDKLCTIVSPEKSGDTLWINQDAWYSLGAFSRPANVDYTIHKKGNGVYAFVIEGNISIGENKAGKRDAIGVWESEKISIAVEPGTELMLIEVPMN
ncbi:MAG TPA: pirin family protein [Bacteroidia bacterium]|jgi:redox-sensitive bicupin YhaK (pirin superfamily)|nr:pirin family protein [Bacteroidia bacterium]